MPTANRSTAAVGLEVLDADRYDSFGSPEDFAMIATTTTSLVTADEFLRLHGDETGVELVRGQIVEYPMPGALHGEVCMTAGSIIRDFVKSHRLGRVMSNDTFVKTRTNPDGCRGADVVFIGYATLPADAATPKGALTPPLELVIEVRSPSDSLNDLTQKATEYIDAGVKVVLVIDPNLEAVAVFRVDDLPMRLHNGDELTLPDILPGFAVPVKRFFE